MKRTNWYGRVLTEDGAPVICQHGTSGREGLTVTVPMWLCADCARTLIENGRLGTHELRDRYDEAAK